MGWAQGIDNKISTLRWVNQDGSDASTCSTGFGGNGLTLSGVSGGSGLAPLNFTLPSSSSDNTSPDAIGGNGLSLGDTTLGDNINLKPLDFPDYIDTPDTSSSSTSPSSSGGSGGGAKTAATAASAGGGLLGALFGTSGGGGSTGGKSNSGGAGGSSTGNNTGAGGSSTGNNTKQATAQSSSMMSYVMIGSGVLVLLTVVIMATRVGKSSPEYIIEKTK